jgi:polysaccharide export outer membrane protein
MTMNSTVSNIFRAGLVALSLAAVAMGRVSAANTVTSASPPPASSSAAATPNAASELTSPSLYQVCPGDILSISVIGFEDLTSEPTVTPDGMISVALLGPLKVSGLTTDQVAAMLISKWSKYVINPPVTVAVKLKHQQLISVFGWVAHPGPADYTPNLHLLQAIALVGGSLPTGDLRRVTVTHRDGSSQTVDVSNPAAKGGTPADIVLQEQDNVFVPENLDEFEVLGSVNQPGSYPFKPNTKILDAITAAGGVTLQTADLQHASLLHAGKATTMDLTALIVKGDQSENALIAPGDSITIPLVQNREYVFGDVAHPGYVLYKPGDRVLDALNDAGPQNDASLWKINVIRQDKTQTNIAHLQVVDVKSFLLRGQASGNPLIQPGDVLYVPSEPRLFSLNDMIGTLASINVLNVGTKILTGNYLTNSH